MAVDGISKGGAGVANPQNHDPDRSSRRDKNQDMVELGRTHSAQRQFSGVSSARQPRPPQQPDLNSRRKNSQRKDHAVVAPDARITKDKSSRSRCNSMRSHNSKNTTTRPSLQVAPKRNTATLGPRSLSSIHKNPSVDNSMPSSTLRASSSLDLPRKFIIGLDFGTTTTAVSYYSHSVEDLAPMALPGEVYSIMNWPGDGNEGVMKQVPTESWYSSIPRIRPPLQDQLGLDNLDPESSDSSDDEDTSSEASIPQIPSVAHPEALDRESDTYKLGGCNCAESTRYIWGYDVFNARYHEFISRDVHTRIERSKSMLVRSSYTQDDRDVLRASLDHLLELQLIRKYGKKEVPIPRDIQDVISDFLTEVLTHTGQQLAQFAGLTKKCPVSFVITVPVIWSPHSSRVFQCAMEDAIQHSGFGDLRHGKIDNLYITTEPEAAATYLLATADNILVSCPHSRLVKIKMLKVYSLVIPLLFSTVAVELSMDPLMSSTPRPLWQSRDRLDSQLVG